MSDRCWYYEEEGAREGPVGEPRLFELFELGVVREMTLVWTEGMAEWQEFATVLPVAINSETDDRRESDLETCAVSGKRLPRSQMLPFGDRWVAPEHREELVQRLEEGGMEDSVPLPGHPFASGLSPSSLFSQTWEIWSAQWWLLTGFAGVIHAPFLLAFGFLAGSDPGSANPFVALFSQLVQMVAGVFVIAGLFAYALDRWNGGGAWDVGRLFRGAMRHFGKVLYTRILVSLIVFPAAFIMGFVGVATGSYAVLAGALILVVPLLVYLGNRLMSAEAFSLVIGRGGGAATGRSWERSRGRFWRLLLYRLVIYSPIVMVSGAMGALAAIPPMNHWAFNVVVGLLGVCLTTPCTVFEMILALHLEANPTVSDSTGPESPKEEAPRHDLVA